MNLKNYVVTYVALVYLSIMTVGCATVGPLTLGLTYQPPTGPESLLSSIPTRNIKLTQFVDRREQKAEAIMIGSREAAFGVPMGEVYSDRPIFEIVRDSIKEELTRNGHTVVTDNEDIVIGGEIQKFWIGTDVTMLYWDVIGEVTVILEVKKTGDVSTMKLGPYGGKKVERTYSSPKVELLERVLGGALQDAIKTIGSDAILINALKKN
jgi:hypothetical protein